MLGQEDGTYEWTCARTITRRVARYPYSVMDGTEYRVQPCPRGMYVHSSKHRTGTVGVCCSKGPSVCGVPLGSIG